MNTVLRGTGLGLATALLGLVLAGCGEDSALVKFADEGDRCRDTDVVYVDDDGDELNCEGWDYRGP